MNLDDLLNKVESDTKPLSTSSKDPKFDNVMDHISENWEIDNKRDESKEIIESLRGKLKKSQDEYNKLLKDFKKIKAERDYLLNQSDTQGKSQKSIIANTEKILIAIKENSKGKEGEWVPVSLNKLIKKYKVSGRKFQSCITYAQENKIFETKETQYTENVSTYAFKILHS